MPYSSCAAEIAPNERRGLTGSNASRRRKKGREDLADVAELALLLGVLEGGHTVDVRHGGQRRGGSSASAGSRGVSIWPGEERK
jgi:hypothetical protein